MTKVGERTTAYTKRYQIHNAAWTRTGPRKGFWRRRGWVLRTKPIGEADDIVVAAQILAQASFYANEAIFIYDNANHGKMVGAQYGWSWK